MSVSVVIVCFRGAGTLPHVLEGLGRQTLRPLEVILVDSGDDNVADWVRERHPHVQVHRSAHRLFPGEARNLAVSYARGDLVAFLDADCVPAEDWLEQILMVHKLEGQLIVGGSVANGAQGRTAWASYLCEFATWMPGQPRATMTDVPTCSLSTFRELLVSRPFVTGTYCSDTAWNWAMGRRGKVIRFEPSIRVSHLGHTRPLRWLRKHAMHGRAFARVRVSAHRFTRTRSAIFTIGSLVLPILLSWRTAVRVWRQGQYRSELWNALPLVILGHIVWSAGECAGYAERAFKREVEA